jgi:hypothetical protein
MFALLSVWIALGALITSIVMVIWRSPDRESVITLLPYTIALSATLAAGVLWGLRQRKNGEPGVAGQRAQAIASIAANSLTFAVLLVWLHGVVNGLLGLTLEGAFLCFVYWLYTRILVPH